MAIDYSSKIPNNVDLASNKQLQRALEHWQPKYLDWWREMGPDGSAERDVYLRTAVSVDAKGWAHFDYVKMPEYRWGIFLTPHEEGRLVGFGQHRGIPAWNEVPGEYRSTLRRIIVTQGDTEPASVEQQRMLGHTCPSLYDLRNLYQVNVEEGRHLWAMVYLLHAYFGRDGREEGEGLLERRSGDADKPRILGAFNEKTTNWLSFFFFTFLTDRDGKYQLAALAESGFDPLSRSTRFMLTEEAHHLFVGESGIARILQRTAEVMKAEGTDNPDALRRHGVIDIPTIQRFLNFHFSVTLDLYGGEVSSNAADFYAMGLKGRFEESKIDDDHVLKHAHYPVAAMDGDKVVSKDVAAPLALNERLRDDYIKDCEAGVERWNRALEKLGVTARLRLPHKTFHRKIGAFAGRHVSPEGEVLGEAAWRARSHAWLPSDADHAYLQAISGAVTEPGKYANWIAPPPRGINNQAADFAYVRFH
ncbi:MAG: benzoyl-CoA 2,3-epoxidase subunit BoxB [Polyangiales bacterium]